MTVHHVIIKGRGESLTHRILLLTESENYRQQFRKFGCSSIFTSIETLSKFERFVNSVGFKTQAEANGIKASKVATLVSKYGIALDSIVLVVHDNGETIELRKSTERKDKTFSIRIVQKLVRKFCKADSQLKGRKDSIFDSDTASTGSSDGITEKKGKRDARNEKEAAMHKPFGYYNLLSLCRASLELNRIYKVSDYRNLEPEAKRKIKVGTWYFVSQLGLDYNESSIPVYFRRYLQQQAVGRVEKMVEFENLKSEMRISWKKFIASNQSKTFPSNAKLSLPLQYDSDEDPPQDGKNSTNGSVVHTNIKTENKSTSAHHVELNSCSGAEPDSGLSGGFSPRDSHFVKTETSSITNGVTVKRKIEDTDNMEGESEIKKLKSDDQWIRVTVDNAVKINLTVPNESAVSSFARRFIHKEDLNKAEVSRNWTKIIELLSKQSRIEQANNGQGWSIKRFRSCLWNILSDWNEFTVGNRRDRTTGSTSKKEKPKLKPKEKYRSASSYLMARMKCSGFQKKGDVTKMMDKFSGHTYSSLNDFYDLLSRESNDRTVCRISFTAKQFKDELENFEAKRRKGRH